MDTAPIPMPGSTNMLNTSLLHENYSPQKDQKLCELRFPICFYLQTLRAYHKSAT